MRTLASRTLEEKKTLTSAPQCRSVANILGLGPLVVQCKFPRTLTFENLFYCPLDRRRRVGKAQVEARADNPHPGGGPRGGRGWGRWGRGL